jgi:hypothetical protein
MADGSQLTSPNLLAEMASQLGGAQALPAIQRSQYLAEALSQMRQSAGQNLKSPLALGSNLLAEALLNYKREQTNQQLMGVIGGARSSMLSTGDDITDPSAPTGTGASGTPAAGAGMAQPAAGGASPPMASAVPVGPSPQASGLADALSPVPASAPAPAPPGPSWQSTLAQARANPTGFFGSALGVPVAIPPRGGFRTPAQNAAVGGAQDSEHMANAAWDLSPQGMSTGAATAKLAQSGLPFDQIIDEGNHAHFGLNPGGRERGQVLQLTGPHQYSPIGQMGQLAPGQQPPAPSAFADAGGGTNDQSTAASAQAPPAPRPLQVSTGPDPSVASPGAQGPAAASPFQPQNPAQSSPGAANSPPPQPGGGASSQPQFGQPGWQPPPVPLNSQQFAQFQRLRALAQQSPQLYMAQYQQMVQQLHQQLSTPEPLDISRPNEAGQVTVTGKLTGRVYGLQSPSGAVVAAAPKMTTDGQGGFVPVPSTQTVPIAPLAPGVFSQHNNATGATSNEAIPNAVQSGQVWDQASGSYKPLRGLQPQVSGGYAPGTVFSQTPGQAPQVVQAPQWGSQQVLQVRDSAMGSEQYKNYTASNDAWKAMVANASTQNGMTGYALRDTFARVINPGAVARVGTIQAIKESPGIPDQIKGMLLQLGPGGVPPQIVQQTLDAALPFAQSNDHAARLLDQSNQTIIKNHGLNPGDVALPMDAPPQRFVVPQMRAPQPQPGAPAGGAIDAASAAAELQRRGYRLVNGQWTK